MYYLPGIMFLYLETLKIGNFGIGILVGETNGLGARKKMARSFFYLQLCYRFLRMGGIYLKP
jgi:hypothetical protein